MFSTKLFICDSFAEFCKALLEEKDLFFKLCLINSDKNLDLNEDLKNAVSFIKACASTNTEQIQKRLFEESFVSLIRAESWYSGRVDDMSTVVNSIKTIKKERQDIEENQSDISSVWEFLTGQNNAKHENDFKLKKTEKKLEDSFISSFLLSNIRVLLGVCYNFMGDKNSMFSKLDNSLSFYVDYLKAIQYPSGPGSEYAFLFVASASAVCEYFGTIDDCGIIESLKNYNQFMALVPLKKVYAFRTYYLQNPIISSLSDGV